MVRIRWSLLFPFFKYLNIVSSFILNFQILPIPFLIWRDILPRAKSTLIGSCTTGRSTHQSTYCLPYLVWWSRLSVRVWLGKITPMSPISWSVFCIIIFLNYYYYVTHQWILILEYFQIILFLVVNNCCYLILTVRLLCHRQRRAGHEGCRRWRSSNTGRFALFGIFDEIREKLHRPRKLRKSYRLWIAGHWLAVVAYLPQRDVETYPCQCVGRVLPSRCPSREIKYKWKINQMPVMEEQGRK